MLKFKETPVNGHFKMSSNGSLIRGNSKQSVWSEEGEKGERKLSIFFYIDKKFEIQSFLNQN